MTFLIIFLVWIICFTISLGLINSHMRARIIEDTKREIMIQYGEVMMFAFMFSLFGPVGIFLALCISGFGCDGFDLKPKVASNE